MEKGAKASLIHTIRFIQRHAKKCQMNKKSENGSGAGGDLVAAQGANGDDDEENDADVSSSDDDAI
eukprot:CAMPEP_0178997498 /NCGR_PEP_ID=MMETSP0795-20121207/8966_1 /TAXON_ID=88552 /ORGANISM="Amoebophrya sp., Strain Ameob2" /LENGTH=65 /DNA_ID=CAMNT_0020690023 /DNA_START=332 /DNA_END=529 /DNA_ORIENTATION=+